MSSGPPSSESTNSESCTASLAALERETAGLTDTQIHLLILEAQQTSPTAFRRYGPLTPTARQREFLSLDCDEVLFGGAVGGSKSMTLLMWLAEGVHVPGYCGLAMRRTFEQIEESKEGLLEKSKVIYPHLGGILKGRKRWVFPSGATVEFGALAFERSIDNYQGPSYHRIALDELTQFSERQYLWMNGRIRRTVGFPIKCGIRGASNPGGRGHGWVKERFVTAEALAQIGRLSFRDPSPPGTVFFSENGRRAFVPARLADNPYLDFDDYVGRLQEFDPVTAARMLNGDWSVREDARIDPAWLRDWVPQAGQYRLLSPRGSEHDRLVPMGNCERFLTIDTAGSTKDVTNTARTGIRSRNVISVWDRHGTDGTLVWHFCDHGFWEFPVLLDHIIEAHRVYNQRGGRIMIEGGSAGSGRAAVQMLADQGYPVEELQPDANKLARAGPWLNMLKQGNVYMPADAPWRSFAEAEMLSWTGHKDEPADFIDTGAYAGLYCTRDSGKLVYELEGREGPFMRSMGASRHYRGEW